jgi:hypothetical protein
MPPTLTPKQVPTLAQICADMQEGSAHTRAFVTDPRPRLSLYEFADSIGVKRGTVKRWRSEGMPSTEVNGRVFVFPDEATPWVDAHANQSTFHKDCVCRVYFARKGELIKIGTSVEPERRLQRLQVDEVLVTVPGDKRVELAFHALFAGAAVGNEWFRQVPELLSLIESLKAA